MAMTFGKGNRSIAFNPTSAFPLDARSYFESYEAALAAAQSAAMAGDTNTNYYFGQTVVVVENEVATLYVIQPNKTLVPFSIDDGSTIAVDVSQFEFDENGKLMLKGAADAAPGSLVSVDENGALVWIAPIDTYTKTEIDNLIANVDHLKRKIVADLDEIETYAAEHDDADHYIFMVPTGLQEDSDKYDEYIVVEGIVEKIGSWEVDLSDYAKISTVEAALENKVDKVEGYGLISNADLAKLLNIEAEAQKNYISSVDSNFQVTNGQLILNNLSIDKITNLADQLNQKVDKIDGWTLLSPTDQDKLAKLSIDESGQVGISGTINIENVQGLTDWLNSHAGNTPGLSKENFSTELKNKLESILLISSVDDKELKVENGKLSIIEVNPDKITGLQEALSERLTEEQVNTKVSTAIDALNTALADIYVTKTIHQQDIDAIWDVLTWKDIPTE